MSQVVKFFIILAVVIYVISPYDIIPDFMVPFLGWIDDTVLISMLIYFLRTGKFPGIFSRKGRPMYGRGSFGSNENPAAGSGYRENSRREEFSRSGSDDAHRKTEQMEKTPHEILGVSPGATQEEIRAAYISLAKQYHPDKVAHLGKELQELADKRFKEIQQAYARLSPGTRG